MAQHGARPTPPASVGSPQYKDIHQKSKVRRTKFKQSSNDDLNLGSAPRLSTRRLVAVDVHGGVHSGGLVVSGVVIQRMDHIHRVAPPRDLRGSCYKLQVNAFSRASEALLRDAAA